MTYTLWSNGSLLGHTDLGFRANTESVKFGWLFPTEAGEGAMHGLTDCSRIILERDDVDLVTLSADLCSASSRIEAMSLELHDERGIVMNTESISIRDSEIMLAFANRDDTFDELRTRSFEEILEEDANCDAEDFEWLEDHEWLFEFEAEHGEDWSEPPPLPRYQIIVFLPDSASSHPAP